MNFRLVVENSVPPALLLIACWTRAAAKSHGLISSSTLRNFASSHSAPYVLTPMTCSTLHVGSKLRDTRWPNSSNPTCSTTFAPN